MSFMTRIPGVSDRDDIKPGMASFEGSGPIGKTCLRSTGLLAHQQEQVQSENRAD
jgi:hypothetical protein